MNIEADSYQLTFPEHLVPAGCYAKCSGWPSREPGDSCMPCCSHFTDEEIEAWGSWTSCSVIQWRGWDLNPDSPTPGLTFLTIHELAWAKICTRGFYRIRPSCNDHHGCWCLEREGIFTVTNTLQGEVDLLCRESEVRAVPSPSSCVRLWVDPLTSRKKLSSRRGRLHLPFVLEADDNLFLFLRKWQLLYISVNLFGPPLWSGTPVCPKPCPWPHFLLRFCHLWGLVLLIPSRPFISSLHPHSVAQGTQEAGWWARTSR